jgi:hypothetical protein
MDQQKLLEIAGYVTNVKLYPYFEAAHYIVVCLMVRDDVQSRDQSGGSVAFSRKHPLACWIASMLMCFAGSILGNLLVGESVVVPFKHQDELLLASAVWYAINYSPFDVVYKLCKFLPVRLAAQAADQLHVASKVHQGVTYALKHYTGAYVIAVVIGVVKGAGHCFMTPFQRLVCGSWVTSSNSFLYPTFEFKSALVASIIFIIQARGIYITAPFSIVYFGVVMFLVYFSIVSDALGTRDPFSPFENIICTIFFGGLVDAVKRLASRGSSHGTGSTDGGSASSMHEKTS